MSSTFNDGIIFPDGMDNEPLSPNTIFLTAPGKNGIPTSTTTEDLKKYMEGEVGEGDAGFITGDAIYVLTKEYVKHEDGMGLMPMAKPPDNTAEHFLNALGEYQKVSANNFTDELKKKLDGVETGAQVNIQSDYSETNTNAAGYIKSKPDLTVLQSRTDDTLITDSKQIVGAINEINSSKENKGVASGLIAAHDQNDSAHQDIRNSIENIAGGSVVVQKSEFAEKLGNSVSSYTKNQLDILLNKLVKDLLLNETNYVLTVQYQDGTTKEIDFPIEATVKDGRFDTDTNELVLVLVSGQEIRIPAAGLVKVYVGKETTTTTTVVGSDGKIGVDVNQGAIKKTHLHAELVAEIEGHQTIAGDTKDNITTFTEAPERINIASGDKQSVLFGKIMKWFSSLKALAFKDKVDWDADIDNRPAIPDISDKVDKVIGKQLSTEDISIVITPTLDSSYPEGTIVIKTA